MVGSRRWALSRRARGRILDLGGAASHRALWDTTAAVDITRLGASFEDELVDLADAGDRFDTVLSVFRLVAADDVDRTLGSVRRLLDDDGQLLFLEPGRHPGSTSWPARILAPGVRAATGWHPRRDVPSMLRAADLSITDLRRHRTATVQWWLRSVLEGCAHRALEPNRPPP